LITIETLEKAKSKARRAQFTSELSDDVSDREEKKFKRNPPSSTECPIYSGMCLFSKCTTVILKVN